MSIAYWSSARFATQAATWLDEALAAAGLARTGEVAQPHLRPWATVLRAPTSGGMVWLKAGASATAFEAGLYELLHEVSPEHVLAPIAVDVARGWVLLPDGGTTLAEQLAGPRLVDALAVVLGRYGLLQRAVAPHVRRLLDVGVRDMRPAALPARFEEALLALRHYVQSRTSDDERRAFERAAGLGARVEAWAERLASAVGGASIDHNDLHARNILLGSHGASDARFFDWGDSVVAHPFASMLVPLTLVQRRVLRCELDDPRLLRVRDAYLEAFADLAPHAELVDALELACRAAKVARTLTWVRALAMDDPRDIDDAWRSEPLRCFASLADESHLGGT